MKTEEEQKSEKSEILESLYLQKYQNLAHREHSVELLYQQLIELKPLFLLSTDVRAQLFYDIKFIISLLETMKFSSAPNTPTPKMLEFISQLQFRFTRALSNLENQYKLISEPYFEIGIPHLDTKRTFLDMIRYLTEIFQIIGKNLSSISSDIDVENSSVDAPTYLSLKLGVLVSTALKFSRIYGYLAYDNYSRLERVSKKDEIISIIQLLLKNFIETSQSIFLNYNKFLEREGPFRSLFEAPSDLDSRSSFFVGQFMDNRRKERIFLSHRGGDIKSELVERLEFAKERSGVFLDCLNVPNGQSCRRFVIESLVESNDALFILSNDFWNSKWCREEVYVWNALCAMDHLLQHTPSRKTAIWCFDEGGLSVRRIIRDQLNLIPHLHLDQSFTSIDVMLDELPSLIQSWHPKCDEEFPLSAGFIRPTQGLIDFYSWAIHGCPLIKLFYITASAIKEFDKLLRLIELSLIIDISRVENLPRLMEQIIETKGKLAIIILNQAEMFHNIYIRNIDLGRSNYGELFEMASEAMKNASVITSLMGSTVLMQFQLNPSLFDTPEKLCDRSSLVIIVGLLNCVLQRLRDVYDILLMKKDCQSPIAGRIALIDKNLQHDQLDNLMIVIIDNLHDVKALTTTLDDLSSHILTVGGANWTVSQWAYILLGLGEQYRFRRRIIVPSNTIKEERLPYILSSRDIIYISKGQDRSFVDQLIMLLLLLHLNSHMVIVTQCRGDESGLTAKCGELVLEDLPHFTLKTLEDILWTFQISERIYAAIDKISDQYSTISTALVGLTLRKIFKITSLENFSEQQALKLCLPFLGNCSKAIELINHNNNNNNINMDNRSLEKFLRYQDIQPILSKSTQELARKILQWYNKDITTIALEEKSVTDGTGFTVFDLNIKLQNPIFRCDACELFSKEILHWKCQQCPKFNLCNECYKTKKVSHQHIFQQLPAIEQIISDLAECRDLLTQLFSNLSCNLKIIESTLRGFLMKQNSITEYWRTKIDSALSKLQLLMTSNHKLDHLDERPSWPSSYEILLQTLDNMGEEFISMIVPVVLYSFDEEVEKNLQRSELYECFQLGILVSCVLGFITTISNIFQEWINIPRRESLLHNELYKIISKISTAQQSLIKCIDQLLGEEQQSMKILFQKFKMDSQSSFYVGWSIDKIRKERVYISHCGGDIKSALVKRLEFAKERSGVFLDCLNVPNGQSCRRFVIESLVESNDALFILSNDFWNSKWCREEVYVWNALCAMDHLLQHTPSRKTAIWCFDEGGLSVRRIIQDQLNLIPRLHLDQSFTSIDVMLDELPSLIQSWVPDIKVFSLLDSRLRNSSYSRLDNTQKQDQPEFSLFTLVSSTNQALKILKKYRSRMNFNEAEILSFNNKLSGWPEIHQLEENIYLARDIAQNLIFTHSDVLSHHSLLTFDLANHPNLQQLLNLLNQGMESSVYLLMQISRVFASKIFGVEITVLNNSMLLLYYLIISFMCCSFERFSDCYSLLLKKTDRSSLAFDGEENEKKLHSENLIFYLSVAIDNIIDARNLLYSSSATSQILHTIFGYKQNGEYTEDTILRIFVGLKEQIEPAKVITVSTGDYIERLGLILAPKEIVYDISGTKRSIVDDVIVMITLLHLQSHVVTLASVHEDNSIFSELKYLPILTFSSLEDIMRTFCQFDETYELILKLSEEFQIFSRSCLAYLINTTRKYLQYKFSLKIVAKFLIPILDKSSKALHLLIDSNQIEASIQSTCLDHFFRSQSFEMIAAAKSVEQIYLMMQSLVQNKSTSHILTESTELSIMFLISNYIEKLRSKTRIGELEIHDNISCDCCEASPVVGKRWNCQSFDLCNKCYEKKENHDPNHDFLQVQLPSMAQVEGECYGVLQYLFDIHSKLLKEITIYETLFMEFKFECNNLFALQFYDKWKQRVNKILNKLNHPDILLKEISFTGKAFYDVKEYIENTIDLSISSFTSIGTNISEVVGDFEAEKFLEKAPQYICYQFGNLISTLMTYSNDILEQLQKSSLIIGRAITYDELKQSVYLLLSSITSTRILILDDSYKLKKYFEESSLDSRSAFFIGRCTNKIPKERVYISHCGGDIKSELVERLEFAKERSGVFLDCLNVPNGQSCRRFVIESLVESNDALFILSNDFWNSKWCREEVYVWNALCAMDHLLQHTPSRKTAIWCFDEGGLSVRHIIRDQLNLIPRLHLDQSFTSIDVMLDELPSLIQSWVPECDEELIISLIEPIFKSLDFWSEEESQSMKIIMPLILKSINLLERITLSVNMPLYDRMKWSMNLTNYQLISEREEKLALLISYTKEIYRVYGEHLFSKTIRELDMQRFGEIINNISVGLELAVENVCEFSAAIAIQVNEDLSLSLEKKRILRAHSFNLAFLGCGFERLYDLLLFISSDHYQADQFNNLAKLIFENVLDAQMLTDSLEEVGDLISLVNGDHWNQKYCATIFLGLLAQRDYRSRVTVTSGMELPEILQHLPFQHMIYIYNSKKSHVDEVIALLTLLRLHSHQVMQTNIKKDSLINLKSGEINLGDIPHFTLDNANDIVWHFYFVDRVRDYVNRIFDTDPRNTPKRIIAMILKHIISHTPLNKFHPNQLLGTVKFILDRCYTAVETVKNTKNLPHNHIKLIEMLFKNHIDSLKAMPSVSELVDHISQLVNSQ